MSNFFAALNSDSEEEVDKVAKPAKQENAKVNQRNATKDKKKPDEKTRKPENSKASGTGVLEGTLTDMSLKEKNTDKYERRVAGARAERGRRFPARRGGKREYDRRSGTGRGKEISKDGAGSHNWGKAGDELEEQVKEPAELNPEDDNQEEKPAPEPVELTLEEYLAQKANKRTGRGFEELKSANIEEVRDGKAYAKKDSKQADEEEAFIPGKGGKQKRVRDRKKEHIKVETGFYVKDTEEDDRESRPFRGRGRGGFRGGRGRGRGGARGAPGGRGGRGGGRGGRGEHGAKIDTTAPTEFPALGATN